MPPPTPDRAICPKLSGFATVHRTAWIVTYVHGSDMRSPRFPFALPVRYRVAGSESWLTGTTQNISSSGVLFAAEQRVEVNTPIELAITLPRVKPIEAPGEVRGSALVVRTGDIDSSPTSAFVAAAFADIEFSPARNGEAS